MKHNEEQIAVISDIHGNSLALRAVLDDIDNRGIGNVLNLGDSLYGPLDPAETADMLIARQVVSVLGNEDRILLESLDVGSGEAREDEGGMEGSETGSETKYDRSNEAGSTNSDALNPSLGFTLSRLNDEHLDWLWSLPQELNIDPGFYLCHGTPSDDTEYLLWEVGELGARKRKEEGILARLEGIEAGVTLCGHDHIQADRRLPGGMLVVDPGSVGLPAYTDDLPFPHRMEAGSPHARYSILRGTGGSWEIEHRSIEYDWLSASRMAAENGRPDWAEWLLHGRAAPVGRSDS